MKLIDYFYDNKELSDKLEEADANATQLQSYCDEYFKTYDRRSFTPDELKELFKFIEEVMWFINDDMPINHIMLDQLKENL